MPGFKELLIILVVVLIIFGAGRLKNIGKDLGAAIKNFKEGMSDIEAIEWMEFNVVNAYVGENTPVFVHTQFYG